MTDASQAADRPARPDGEIVDAEFEDVTPARAARPRKERHDRHPPSDTADPAGMASLRHDGSGAATDGGDNGGFTFWATGIVLIFAAFWFSGGYSMVLRTPFGLPPAPEGPGAGTIAPADPENPLHFANVTTNIQMHAGRQIILVDGQAVNGGDSPLPLPPIAIEVAGTDGVTTRYFLGTNGRVLAPGERYAFSSRLIAPKNGADDVSVRFSPERR